MSWTVEGGDGCKIIGTLAPPHQRELMEMVTKHPLVYGYRFNSGARCPFTKHETITAILESGGPSKVFWLDLKGRQMRIEKWAVPPYAPIIMNHTFTVDTPATLWLRGNQRTTITSVVGNKAYVYPPPTEVVGAGQAVNVHGTNLKIHGFLTAEDKEYMQAAKDLGVHKYMLSFVEEVGDLTEVLDIDSEAEMVLKIESPKGMEFVDKIFPTLRMRQNISLMAARDDLHMNIGDDKTAMIPAMELIIQRDPAAMAASHIMTSLMKAPTPSMGDLADVYILQKMGYKSFMFSDSLSQDKKAFPLAVTAMQQFISRYGTPTPPHPSHTSTSSSPFGYF